MIDQDDEAVWESVVSDVRPLPEKNVVCTSQKKKRIRAEKTVTLPLKIFKHDVSLGTTADIDRNTMRRFKREEFPVEAVLDLHGYNEEQAYQAVHQFLTNAYLTGKRCVIIVTGKGLPHADEDIFAPRGVLRNRVPQWLQDDEMRQIILSYIHPSVRLGGQGALYILLRRRR